MFVNPLSEDSRAERVIDKLLRGERNEKTKEIKSAYIDDNLYHFSKNPQLYLSFENQAFLKGYELLHNRWRAKGQSFTVLNTALVEAGSLFCTKRKLYRLSRSRIWIIRFRTAQNPLTSTPVLTKLLLDSNMWVQLAALKNPWTPDHALRTLSKRKNLIKEIDVLLKKRLKDEYTL